MLFDQVDIEYNGQIRKADLLERNDKKIKISFPNTTTAFNLSRTDTTKPYTANIGGMEMICRKA